MHKLTLIAVVLQAPMSNTLLFV